MHAFVHKIASSLCILLLNVLIWELILCIELDMRLDGVVLRCNLIMEVET